MSVSVWLSVTAGWRGFAGMTGDKLLVVVLTDGVIVLIGGDPIIPDCPCPESVVVAAAGSVIRKVGSVAMVVDCSKSWQLRTSSAR